MNRSHIPTNIETSVLIRSRRRCALCYGLHGDDDQKDGQIAHINRNSNDSRLENLAFLCLQHHDQYDTHRSQSKERPLRAEDSLFSEFRELVPEKWRHVYEEALDFYTGPHRAQSAVLLVLDGPKSVEAIAEQIPPNDIAQTDAIIVDAVGQGWVRRSIGRTNEYEATVRARLLVEALADLPEAVKDAAVKIIWSPRGLTPV